MSFYNETSGRSIFPTPTIGVVGILDAWERHVGSHFPDADLPIYLLGPVAGDIAASEWLALRRGIEAGTPPAVDLALERGLHELLAEGVAKGWINSAHDISAGGLAVALAESCFGGPGRSRVGAAVSAPPESEVSREAFLFGEAAGRVLVTTGNSEALEAAAGARDLPCREIGRTGGERLAIGPGKAGPETSPRLWIDTEVERLEALWRRAIPRRLENG